MIFTDGNVLVLDSITAAGPSHRNYVAVAGSHGGVYPAYLAASLKLRGVILNDAGVGLEAAGIACLPYLDAIDMAAATVSYKTARIGDGRDMLARGVISYANAAARRTGCAPGISCAEAAERMQGAKPPVTPPPPYDHARVLLRHDVGKPPVWGIDSNSLARAEDAGTILVTGSHGGLLGGDPGSAIHVQALAVVFNDAGIGIDSAGISRLPALDARDIAAAAVSATSARIGDARSTWTTGLVSTVNGLAAAIGVVPRMTIPSFVDRVIAHRRAGALIEPKQA